jgi:hypothetical protein
MDIDSTVLNIGTRSVQTTLPLVGDGNTKHEYKCHGTREIGLNNQIAELTTVYNSFGL